MIVSHTDFIYFCTALTAGVSGAWLISDVVRMARLSREPVEERRDRFFGYIMGIAIGAIGIAGVLKFHFG